MATKKKVSIKKVALLVLFLIISYLFYAIAWNQKNSSYKPGLSPVTDQELIEDLERLRE